MYHQAQDSTPTRLTFQRMRWGGACKARTTHRRQIFSEIPDSLFMTTRFVVRISKSRTHKFVQVKFNSSSIIFFCNFIIFNGINFLGDLSGAKDTCSGDSGGAIYVFDKYESSKNKFRFIAAGVVSYGNGCSRQGFGAIYTRISSYIDWIYVNM
jgi:hypothetical protein